MRCTEIGTLELYCVAKDGNNRWRLEFNVRDIVKDADDGQDAAASNQTVTDVWPEEQVQEAAGKFARCMSQEARDDPQHLTKALEAALEAGRDTHGRRACAAGSGSFWRKSPISAGCRPLI